MTNFSLVFSVTSIAMTLAVFKSSNIYIVPDFRFLSRVAPWSRSRTLPDFAHVLHFRFAELHMQHSVNLPKFFFLSLGKD